jgi:hypothetical protein
MWGFFGVLGLVIFRFLGLVFGWFWVVVCWLWFIGLGLAVGVFESVSDGDFVSDLEWFVACGTFSYFWFHRFSSHVISSHFSVSGLSSHICVSHMMSSLADCFASVCLLLIECVMAHAFSSSLTICFFTNIVVLFRSIVAVSIH